MKISANRTRDGLWVFAWAGDLRQGFGVREYTAQDVAHVLDWIAEREAGYPKRDLPWHEIGCLSDGTPIPKPLTPTRSG